MKTATRFNLTIEQESEGVYNLSVKHGPVSNLLGILVRENDGWVLDGPMGGANVTLLPGGGIDWEIVMEKTREWSV